jgi:hypothetical protein
MTEKKENRYQYEVVCNNQNCGVKGVMQEYKSSVKKNTIKCVSCGNDIVLTLIKVNLLYQEGAIE